MKKIFLILAAVMMLPWLTEAQDGRNRLVTTVIADAMAQLPAQDQTIYNTMMADLAGTGTEGVVRMAGMLVPADKGHNNIVEYALNGLAAYVTVPGREAMARNMSDGLVQAIGQCDDTANKCFLISLLGTCGNGDNIPFLETLVNDNDTRDIALNTITLLPGARAAIVRQVNAATRPDPVLARLVDVVGATELEDKIIEWAEAVPAGSKRDYYFTMSRIGGEKSFRILEKATKDAGYKKDSDDAISAYSAMLNESVGKGFDAMLLKSAKQTMKSKAPVHTRGAALAARFDIEKKKAMPELVKAVKGNDREYRVNALRLSEPWADADVYEAVNKAAAKNKDTKALVDVINWYGATGNTGQIDVVTGAMNNSNPEVAASAIRAASMIGGEKALSALSAALYGDNSDKAAEALLYFKGDITDCVNSALVSQDAKAMALGLDLADKRHVKASMPAVVKIIDSDRTDLRPAAYKALANVATAKDLDTLVKLAGKAQGHDRAAASNAIKAVLTPMSQDEQYTALKPYLGNAANMPLLYQALAQCGSKDAVNTIREAYDNGDKEALDALLTVNGNDMIPVLFDIATTNAEASTPALRRYAQLVRRSDYSGSQRFNLLTKGLGATGDAGVQSLMIDGLSETLVYPALEVAVNYITKPGTAAASAAAIRNIVSKSNYSGDDVVGALEAAKAYYKAEGSADSGYAVDDINGLIAKKSYSAIFKLSPEEEADGFEVLFDGTTLNRWKGNKTNYIPVDGAIYVTAQYGDHGNGNLYTDKEYSDFIYRFEFCFDAPGVNNGIGIRTSENVDAAYYGMEIQVLEHDAPIYADLRPYQVHGSVYGIIPAKRIKSPQPGVWNTEEIRAVGDHITVTVNGEVILDGNIRKACKGHNVDPGGTRTNPYTVDHLNHPGLFNKKGLISFCGHGPGVRFRNIRIKDLSK